MISEAYIQEMFTPQFPDLPEGERCWGKLCQEFVCCCIPANRFTFSFCPLTLVGAYVWIQRYSLLSYLTRNNTQGKGAICQVSTAGTVQVHFSKGIFDCSWLRPLQRLIILLISRLWWRCAGSGIAGQLVAGNGIVGQIPDRYGPLFEHHRPDCGCCYGQPCGSYVWCDKVRLTTFTPGRCIYHLFIHACTHTYVQG